VAEGEADDRQPEALSNRAVSSGGSSDAFAVPIDQTEREDVLATIRELFSAGGPRGREDAIRDVAHALGYGRVGSRIHKVVGIDLQTAVRRGILENVGGRYSLLCRTIGDYTLDHLVEMLTAAMGPEWQRRDQATTAAARHLGFRRTGQRIQAAFKSAINAAIRRGLVECDGPRLVRRVR